MWYNDYREWERWFSTGLCNSLPRKGTRWECFRFDQLTIGGDDTPAPPASTLWSSEKGLGRLSTHVRPCEFGDSTAGWCGDRNISWEMQVRKQAWPQRTLRGERRRRVSIVVCAAHSSTGSKTIATKRGLHERAGPCPLGPSRSTPQHNTKIWLNKKRNWPRHYSKKYSGSSNIC